MFLYNPAIMTMHPQAMLLFGFSFVGMHHAGP
jgi:hypothetical protein